MKIIRLSQLPKAVLILCVAIEAAMAQGSSPPALTLPLWPASLSQPSALVEHDSTRAGDELIAGQPVIRLTDVSVPTITVYQPPPDKSSGAAVLVAPGGGYYVLAMDLEGTEICEWLNSIGITAVLLKYRVPDPASHRAPLQDAQRAMSLVRGHAQEWHIDGHRIGIIGFSAGADLAARISGGSDRREYPPLDALDHASCRPDFAVLIYPAYLAAQMDGLKLSSGLRVESLNPPTFLAQAEDDPIGVMNSIAYYAALARNKVPSELHVYASGGHGYGLRATGKAVNEWPARLETWLRTTGILNRAN